MPAEFPTMGQWPDGEEQASSKHYALSGKIMLASIITLFIVVVFLVLLHLYVRWYVIRRNRTQRSNPTNRSTRLVYYINSNRALGCPTGGLDASVLKSLPAFVYSSETDANLPECAVCLSEFEDGEKGRILPNCKHSFHTGCIDMWFYTNSTCPLCRSPVELVETKMTILSEPGSLSSPVQQVAEFMETTSSVADRRKRIDVRIDVPNRNESVAESELRIPSPSQGFRSPGSRLLSLKRIISMSRKSPVVSPSSGVGPSCVPVATESDLESGQESSRPGTL